MKIAHIDGDPAFADRFKAMTPGVNITHFDCLGDFIDDNYDMVITGLSLRDGFGAETIDILKNKTESPIFALTSESSGVMSDESKNIILDEKRCLGVFIKDEATIDDMIMCLGNN